jgi:hypothetical protein
VPPAIALSAGSASDGRRAVRKSRTIATLIAASATLNVYQRNVPIPPSTKSTT